MSHITITVTRSGRTVTLSVLWPTMRVRLVDGAVVIEDTMAGAWNNPGPFAARLGVTEDMVSRWLSTAEVVMGGWELPPAA